MTDIDLDIAAILIALTGLLGTLGTAWKIVQETRTKARHDEVQLLREELAGLHERLDAALQKNDAQRLVIDELMKVNTELQLKLAVQGESIKELQAKLEEKEREIAELRREVEALRQKQA